jgi:hypothetical protein
MVIRRVSKPRVDVTSSNDRVIWKLVKELGQIGRKLGPWIWVFFPQGSNEVPLLQEFSGIGRPQ